MLRECARHYLGAPLLGWELLRGGLFNTTYRLDIPGRAAILRLGPVNRHLLLPYEQGLMAAEPAIQELLRAHGVPTSRTVVLDTSKTFLDRDIAIVEMIPGRNMATLELLPQDEKGLCRRAGELTRSLHRATANELPVIPDRPFGRASQVLAGEGSGTWKEAMLLELSQWSECARWEDTFSGEEICRIECCFRRHSSVFDVVSVPALVHGDLWCGNILAGEDGAIAAIIDSDRAYFGDPEFDLMLPWMPSEPFLEGYGMDLDMSENAVLRRKMYRFLLQLEDAYILQVEYRDPEGYSSAKRAVLASLEELENT